MKELSPSKNVTRIFWRNFSVLETKVKEHLSQILSAIPKHCQFTGHSMNSSITKVRATESNFFNVTNDTQLRSSYESLSFNRDSVLANIPLKQRQSLCFLEILV